MEKFTLQEIEKAALTYDGIEGRPYVGTIFEHIKKQLTRPRIEFAEGQVYAIETDTGFHYDCWPNAKPPADLHQYMRLLTTTESGAGELVEALERIAGDCAATWVSDAASRALKKWREDRGE